jgi:hypothetical protein
MIPSDRPKTHFNATLNFLVKPSSIIKATLDDQGVMQGYLHLHNKQHLNDLSRGYYITKTTDIKPPNTSWLDVST